MIRFFAAHPTAANLIMILLLVLGIVAVPKLVRSTFPPSILNKVEVSIAYPGAAPGEVEQAICQRLEDAIDRVDQVERLYCESRENFATALVEADEGVSVDRFLADIRTEIDAIDDFPETAEQPVIRLLGTTEPVVSIAVYGNTTYPVLKDYAEHLKRDLKRLEGVSRVTIQGFTDRQLRVELNVNALRGFGLGVADVTALIRSSNVDMPAGDVETSAGSVTLRIDDERTTPATLSELLLLPAKKGADVRLGDVAKITDTFQFPNQRITFDGLPAAILLIEKNRGDDALDILAEIQSFIDVEQQTTAGINLTLTADLASLVQDRLSMLVVNGLQGLFLVMLILWLFFSARHAFWVGLGLPVSFAGAFALMALFDYQFDMMTLVGLLIAIGILVDDAIVVSENIAVHRAAGKSPLEAAVDGAREVFPGVFASFITTVCIFLPLAFLTGDIGNILKVVPVIIIMTLVVSFLEVFLILPAHLSHGDENASRNFAQRWLDTKLVQVRDYVVHVWVDRFVRWRYLSFGGLIGILLITFSMIASGILGFTPLPELDNESIVARILLPQGSPISRTQSVVEKVLAGLEEVNAELTPEQPGEQSLVRHVMVNYGKNLDAHEVGDHVATVSVDLLSPEIRTETSTEIRQRWREAVGQIEDVIFIKYSDPLIGPQGKALDLRISGDDIDVVRKATDEIYQWLWYYEGVNDLSTDLRPGKPEIRIHLKPGAQALGVNAAILAEQLRGAFFGLIAAEVQVGNERYEIDVRLEASARSSFDTLDGFMVRGTSGQLVPLSAVADLEESRGFARINRIDGRRVITIEGSVDNRATTSAAVLSDFETYFLPDWQARYPDLDIDLEGQNAQAAATLGSLRSGFLLGFLGIFLLLSFQFRSYLEPIVVISIIPLSLIGVVFGHFLLGYNLTMPSMLGFVSLAGIVVNDSILLVTFVENRLAEGMELHKAVVSASHDRFRAILLTSITTVAGLLPLLLETSLQATVVKPLAISLAFGLTSATLLVLFVIPAFYMVLQDLGLFHRHEGLKGGLTS